MFCASLRWCIASTNERGSSIFTFKVTDPQRYPSVFARKILQLVGKGLPSFFIRYRETGSIGRRPGSGRPTKMTAAVKQAVEEQMQLDDDTTASQLHAMLVSKGFELSLCNILRCRASLGWTFRGSAYCQLIRHENKEKRLEWARENVSLNWGNVVWMDECTVQLETHRRFCCRKRGERPKNKPRYAVSVLKSNARK